MPGLWGNQRDPFREWPFLWAQNPAAAGGLGPGRWQYLQACSSQSSTQKAGSLDPEKVTRQTCRSPSGWRESSTLDSDKKLTFEQRELNKREHVKLIWKVLFKSTHAKAFSIKAFILPLAHLPEFSEHGSSEYILMISGKVHFTPEMVRPHAVSYSVFLFVSSPH